MDLTDLEGQKQNIKTSEIEDLDNNKKFFYDDIEEEEIVVEDFQAASEFDDAEKIAEVQNESFNEPIVFTAPIREPASIESYTYTLKENDTLMLVGWTLYGDYKKWREIVALNPNSNFNPGDTINVPAYDSPFVWNPGGNPYLILKDENLSRISVKWYGAGNGYRWKEIWKHNERLIKDPHMIFAGFTIYTLPNKERQIATENL